LNYKINNSMESPLMKKIMKKPSCWKGYKAQGEKKSPSGKKNSDGSPKMVNNCVKIGKK